MEAELRKHFPDIFNVQADFFVKAPGRINIIGEHIDYNHGFVLPACINKAIYFAFSKAEKSFELHNIQRKETYKDGGDADWCIYIEAIFDICREEDRYIAPFRCLFASDLPAGAGLSSSSALCVGLWWGLNSLNGWGLSKLDVALLAKRTEEKTGIQCGFMDQFVITHGKQDKVVLLDCLDHTFQYFDAKMKGGQFVLINSNVNHHLTTSGYNDRRQVAQQAFHKIQAVYPTIQNFRHVSINHVCSSRLGQEEKELCQFIIEEIRRVKEAVKALSKGDLLGLKHVINKGHLGLKDLYKVTCKETDILFELAQKEKGVLAARQIGGGFGGSMLLLVEEGLDFLHIESILEAYQSKTNIEAVHIPIEIGNGVELWT
jgi:galactokinase